MGGPYPDGLFCELCDKEIKDGERIIHLNPGTYCEREECIEYDYWEGSDDIYHEHCVKKRLEGRC